MLLNKLISNEYWKHDNIILFWLLCIFNLPLLGHCNICSDTGFWQNAILIEFHFFQVVENVFLFIV